MDSQEIDGRTIRVDLALDRDRGGDGRPPRGGGRQGDRDGFYERGPRDNYRSEGGYRDGGHREGGHRDGGHREGGGHRDGGYHNGGYRDGGYRDVGYRDGGYRDGGNQRYEGYRGGRGGGGAGRGRDHDSYERY